MEEKISQKKAFLECEGDQWFARNRKNLDFEVPAGYQFYEKFLKPGYKILEVGCSFGKNLRHFHKKCGCICYGIDPSERAVKFGQETFPDLKLSVGTSEKLDFDKGFFDFVLLGFCLYLVDRDHLAQTVAEVDRVLKDKRFLGISDFDLKSPRKRKYKHHEGLFSYKMDYSKLFLAYPHFSMADKYCFSHAADTFDENLHERISSAVLYKDHSNAYLLED